MKIEELGILLALLGLYLHSKPVIVSPLPGQPGFVGPIQQGSSAAIPPAVNMPIQWFDCTQPNADPVMCSILNTPSIPLLY